MQEIAKRVQAGCGESGHRSELYPYRSGQKFGDQCQYAGELGQGASIRRWPGFSGKRQADARAGGAQKSEDTGQMASDGERHLKKRRLSLQPKQSEIFVYRPE